MTPKCLANCDGPGHPTGAAPIKKRISRMQTPQYPTELVAMVGRLRNQLAALRNAPDITLGGWSLSAGTVAQWRQVEWTADGQPLNPPVVQIPRAPVAAWWANDRELLYSCLFDGFCLIDAQPRYARASSSLAVETFVDQVGETFRRHREMAGDCAPVGAAVASATAAARAGMVMAA